MSSAEFTRWVAYSMKEPFGYHVDNFRMGQIASTVFNVGAKKSSPIAPSAFYPESKSLKSKRKLTSAQEEYVRKQHQEKNKSAKKRSKK